MRAIDGGDKAMACKYEAIFCIFLAIMAYMGRENANFIYPAILYLFLMLLSLNFSAIAALRLWPLKRWLSTLIVLANCGVITAILSCSGGPESNLWVLYLLPIYTASLLLGGREVAWITTGAVSFSTIFYVVSSRAWNSAVVFELCLKNGIFIFSAALTWRLASTERLSHAKVRRQREQLNQLEEEIKTQAVRDEQTEKLAKVGLISAGIVHDLKSPLNVIQGFADICLEEIPSDSTLRKDIQSIKKSVLLCQDLVSGILHAARKEEPPHASCEIHKIIESAIELSGSVIESSNIKVRKLFSPQSLHVRGHAKDLERVFLNLIGNAVKAMPSGGTLTIQTKLDGRLSAYPTVQVIIEDTGTGLSGEAIAKLFKPFGTTRLRQGGTGLGLYLCRDIALNHGGSLQAENTRESGARFILSLPLEQKVSIEPLAPSLK